MPREPAVLTLNRSQVLGFRRQVGALDARLPMSAASLRRAAWAVLQDSAPRAALLSIHAREDDTASRLHACLAGRRLPFGLAGRAMGVPANSLRYAAQTGTVLLRWDGARQPVVWTVPPPATDPGRARLELARRYLHVFGPATPASFARWAGIAPSEETWHSQRWQTP